MVEADQACCDAASTISHKGWRRECTLLQILRARDEQVDPMGYHQHMTTN